MGGGGGAFYSWNGSLCSSLLSLFQGLFSGIHIVTCSWHKAFDSAFDVVRWPYRLNDQLVILFFVLCQVANYVLTISAVLICIFDL